MKISHNILIQILIILTFALLVFLLCLFMVTTDFALAENILTLCECLSWRYSSHVFFCLLRAQLRIISIHYATNTTV